jgi:two-component system, NarL family, response regulator
MTAPIRILLVDDNQLTRIGLTTLVGTQKDMEIVGEAIDGPHGTKLFAQLSPNVAVVDLRLPVMDGVQVIDAIRRTKPDAHVLVLTHYDGDENIFRALRAGALGYLTKESPGEEILTAIRTVHAGGRYLPPHIARQLAERTLHPDLTARELQVLERMAIGASNREIATFLEISERTVATYASNVLAKLGAKSRTEAVAIAKQRGLLRG